MDEKRRCMRWHLSGVIQVKDADKLEEETEAKARNISSGGVCFLSKKRYSPESELELIIELPDEQRFLCSKGKVTWQKDEIVDTQERYVETGVSFDLIRDTDKERIFSYAHKFCADELNKKWWEGL